MLQHKTAVLGKSLPTVFLVAGIGALAYFALRSVKNGVSGGISNIFKTDTQLQEDAILKDIFKKLEKNSAVQSQMNVANMTKANTLYDAMNGLGTSTSVIYNVFKDITGPNQMGAIFLSYGKRKLGFWYQTFFDTHEGDLVGALNSELSKSEMNKNINPSGQPIKTVKMVLDTLKTFA